MIRPRIVWRILAIAVACSASYSARAQSSVEELWRGFDPAAEPLDAKVTRETIEDGIVLRTVLYTSEVFDGFTVRVIAYYGFPAGQVNLPAMLHIHGGGGNATLAYVKFWAKRGYASMSVNWGGRPLEGNEANGKTDWGPLPFNNDARNSESLFASKPDSRANPWYHWVIAGRRGITFLAQQPEVDPARIGAFGISMGGHLIWLLAGTDERIRCAASVYGAALMDEPVGDIPGSEYSPAARANPQWRTTLDAYAYAPRIQKPFFYVSSTNDFFGRMDQADRTLRRIPGDLGWQFFSPHFNHHVGPEGAQSLTLWMDRWLKGGPAWPKSPKLMVNLDHPEHVLSARVRPDRADEVGSVSIHYSTGAYPQSRFWRTVPAQREGKAWVARLPMTAIDAEVHAYANVSYKSTLTLSTPLAAVAADRLRDAAIAPSDTPTLLVDDFRRGPVDWFLPEGGPMVLLAEKEFLRPVEGRDSSPAVMGLATASGQWRMFTRKVGDPKWRGPAGAGLQLELMAEKSNVVTVVVVENCEMQPRKPRAYAASARVEGGKWESVTLRMADFVDVYDGTPLANWADINLLGIVGHYRSIGAHARQARRDLGAWEGEPPRIARVQWVLPR